MKKLMIVAVAFCTAFASCKGSKSISNFSEIDSLSYAIGMDLALRTGIMGVPNGDSTINVNAITQAFQDAFANKTQMTIEEASAFINEFFQIRIPAKNKAESQAWLDEVKASNPNIQTTGSGLMYEIINSGDPAVKATSNADQVVVKYRGTLKDGSEFDKNDSIPIALGRVIAGWAEGMKLVGKGGEINLWIPSELGYADRAYGQILPNSALKFEIRLLDVIPAPAAE